MAEKHALFLKGLTSLSRIVPESTDTLKCVAKCYIINEGLLPAITGQKKPLVESVSAHAVQFSDILADLSDHIPPTLADCIGQLYEATEN